MVWSLWLVPFIALLAALGYLFATVYQVVEAHWETQQRAERWQSRGTDEERA